MSTSLRCRETLGSINGSAVRLVPSRCPVTENRWVPPTTCRRGAVGPSKAIRIGSATPRQVAQGCDEFVAPVLR